MLVVRYLASLATSKWKNIQFIVILTASYHLEYMPFTPKQFSHFEKLGLLVGIVVLAFALFLVSDKIAIALYGAIFWIESAIISHPLLGAIAFFLFSVISAIFAFASTILLIPSAILVWGMPLTFFMLLGGWIMGTIITYWIGSKLARPALAFFATEKKLSYYEHLISQEARFWMILLFCLAVPSEIPGFILGAMRYDFTKFVSAIIVTETVYALGSVLIAQNILDKEILSTGGLLLLLIVTITAASALLIHLATRAKKLKDSEQTESP